ncbi:MULTISPECIES: hypothetical protein [Desulfosediminicola]|uniref:hypothetical protein n=1 Tax=Desulfosediminicola TaxID=2886823 RepID=UPI0015938D54|nr:hypothetical protein [Desulfosediminicola ganghwensis]
MIGGEIFIAVSAKEFDISHGLGIPVFNGEAAIRVLYIMCCGNDIVSDLKEILVITTNRTFKPIRYFGLRKRHRAEE